MKKTKQIATTAILTALYFVLSAVLKIPVFAFITLDLGYIALTVAAVYLGAFPALTVGSVGAFLESALMSRRGISPGWIVMNAIVGYASGKILSKTVNEGKRKFMISAFIVIPVSMLVGVFFKTIIDCAIYDLPFMAKIPSGFAAMLADSIVMFLGLPLSLALKKQIK